MPLRQKLAHQVLVGQNQVLRQIVAQLRQLLSQRKVMNK